MDNNLVTDGHTSPPASQWNFAIQSQDGKTGFQCKITITGVSQDVTAPLQACAAPLQPSGGGGGNFTVKTIPCASSMTFTMAGVSPNTGNTYFIVNPLNCNVTTSVVAPPTGGTIQKGALAQFTLINTGGFSFAWPANFADQPTIQSTGPTNAVFIFDGTLWHAQTFPASGGGGGNPAGTQGTIQSTNGTTFSTSNLSEPPTGALAGSFKVNEDEAVCGPNPYVDIRCSGARATNPNSGPAALGLTVNINSGSTSAAISSASTFVNGDGVVIYGAGSPHAMATPTAPTVTPAIALRGTGTSQGVGTPPTGATTMNYKIIARDKNGGLTAASAAGTTTTANTLGAQTVNITSIAATNDSVTFTTAATHGFNPGCTVATCGEVFIGGGNSESDPRFRGWYLVSSAADGTHFTVANNFMDTRNGGSASATGGTATWYNSNRLTWPQVTGAWEYYFYCDRANSGTFSLCGVSRPQGAANTDLTWDDFGSPMMDNFSFPPYVPTSPPGAATSDHLSTTIASGAGTTTLTLANAAGTTVSGATIRLDAAPGILAAATAANSSGGTVTIPVSGSNSFVVNSYLNLSALNIAIQQSGSLYLNETFETKAAWYGDRSPQYGSQNAAGIWQGNPVVSVNTAIPGIYNPQQFGTVLQGVSVSNVGAGGGSNGSLLALYEGGFNMSFIGDAFVTGNGNNDYLGIGLYLRGSAGQSATNVLIDRTLFSTGGPSVDGATHTPVFFCNNCGQGQFRAVYHLHRGDQFNFVAAGGSWKIDHSYINGGFTPLFTAYGGSNNWGFRLHQITMDTIAQPALVAFSNGSGIYLDSYGASALFASSGVPFLSGLRQPVFGAASFGNSVGNRDSSGLVCYSGALDGIYNTGALSRYCVNSNNAAVATSTNYPIFVGGLPPATPTCSVSAGGSLAVGSYQFIIVPLWQNGGEGTPSATSTACTTTTGNQTITINYSAPAGNPKGLDLYYCTSNGTSCTGGFASANTFSNPQSQTSTSFVWSSSAFNTSVYNGGIAGGPTMLMPGVQGSVAPSWTLTGGNFADVHTGTFTANRTVTWPDASGTVALSASAPISLSAAGAISCPNCFDKSTSNNIGQNFIDIGTHASFGNPASGSIRLYADSTSGNLTCLTSAGANCIPGGGGGTPGGSTTQVQFNSAGAFAGNANMTFVSPTLTMGVNGTTTGQVAFANGGVGGASVTVQNTSATVAYNFNLPTGAGTSGQPLLSGGGGSTAMTFGTLGYGGGGTGATSFTTNQLVASGASAFSSLAGTLTGTNPILKLTSASASNVDMVLDTAASQTADILQINLNTVKTSWFDSGALLHTPQTTYTGPGALVLSGSLLSCPGTVAGAAIICLGDLATNMALLSDNGGSFKPIAQFSNASPAAHGVGMAGVTAPQINFSSPGTAGQPFLSGGVAADGAYGALNLAGGATIVTGVLPQANGGTGATSLSGANIITVTGAVTVGHCAQFQASTVIQDAGVTCTGGASPARLDQIQAATAGNTIGNTTFAQRWNWALTGSTTAFIFGESAASTGVSNIILQATTAASSTAIPFQADNNGVGVKLSATGFLTSVTSGGIDSNMLYCDVTSSGKCIQFVLSGITAATTRNKTWTDTAGTIAEAANTITFTNKTYDTAGTGNVFKINGTSITAVGGNTGTVGTTSGTLTSGNLADFDASGNLIDSTVVAANAVTASANFTSGGLVKAAGANKTLAAADLSGDVTTSGGVATTITANAVTSAKTAVVNTRRTCTIVVGADNGSALANADLGPQGGQCFIAYAATVVEIEVKADAGTPNVIVRKEHGVTNTDLLSGALATAASGAIACSNTGGTTGLDGTTTCSSTLQNTSLAAGDFIGLTSGTAGGTAKRMDVHITYTVN